MTSKILCALLSLALLPFCRVEGVKASTPAPDKPELVVQLGHYGGVFSACFSPDSSLLATSGGDGAVKVWDTRSRLLLREWLTGEGHLGGGGPKVAFTPSGHTLISAGKSVRFWDVNSGRLVRQIESGPFDGLAVSPDGRFLALAHRREVEVWALSSATGALSASERESRFERRYLIGDLPSPVAHLAFSRSGLLALGLEGEVRVVRAAAGAPVFDFQGFGGVMQDQNSRSPVPVAFAPDNSLLMSFGKLLVWKGGAKPRAVEAAELGADPFAGSIQSLQFSSDGRELMVAAGSKINLLSWPAAKSLRVIEPDMPDIAVATMSPDGTLIANGVSFNVYAAQLWSARTGKLLATWEGRNGGVNDVALSPNRRFLATATDDGPLRVWDMATHRLLTVGAAKVEFRGVAFSPDSRRVSDSDGNVWDVQTGKLALRSGRKESVFEPKIQSAASVTGKPFEGFGGEIENFDRSPDRRLVAGAAGDLNDETLGAVEVWDAGSGRLLHRLTSEGGAVKAVRFVGDGRVVAGYEDGALRFWNTRSWKLERTVLAHAAWINQLRLSPDGKHVLSAGNDYSVRVWNSHAGVLEATLLILPPEKEGEFSREWLVYTPDGLYDGSPKAETFLRWRIGRKLFPANWGRKFRRSNLLHAVLAPR